jgi:hypothetical protein
MKKDKSAKIDKKFLFVYHYKETYGTRSINFLNHAIIAKDKKEAYKMFLIYILEKYINLNPSMDDAFIEKVAFNKITITNIIEI